MVHHRGRLAVLLLGTAAIGSAQSAPEVIRIDAAAPARPFPHFWEQMFGSGHANLTLRESWRQDLRATKAIADFRYVRFHDIFHDHNGVYSESKDGKPIYNWSYVDQIYDGLLANGVRPFVELSFMPSALAASQKPHPFWYKPLPNPPKSYEKWGTLVGAFTRHLVERYGVDEVRQWYFEVWNEPNIDFWTGKPAKETYFELYDSAARAVKAVDGRLRVGGPATAQAAWVGDFIRHCVEKDIPVDFVTTHVYGNDSCARTSCTRTRSIPQSEMVARAVRKVYDEVKASPRPDLPIIWSEYNATYMNEVEVTDSAVHGTVAGEQHPPVRRHDDHHGVLDVLGRLRGAGRGEEAVLRRLWTDRRGRDSQGGVQRLCAAPPARRSAIITRAEGRPGDTARRWHAGHRCLELCRARAPRRRRASSSSDSTEGRTADVTILDEQHGSALTEWRKMGEPAFPSREQQQALRIGGQAAVTPADADRGRRAPA